MLTIEFASKTIEVDKNGHLINSNDWSEELAEQIAKEERISTLAKNHWEVITFLREYYARYEIAPSTICFVSDFSKKYKKNQTASHDYLFLAFPKGIKQACKIAGLPRPSG